MGENIEKETTEKSRETETSDSKIEPCDCTTEKSRETETSDSKIEPCDCTLEENGDVNCLTTQKNLERIQKKGINPKRLVLEAID